MNSVKELFKKFIGEELTPSQKAKVDTWEKGLRFNEKQSIS